MKYSLLTAVVFALLTILFTVEDYRAGKIPKKTFWKILLPESIAAVLALLLLL